MKFTIPATSRMRSTALAFCALAIAAVPVRAQATQDAPPAPSPSQPAGGPSAAGRMEHMQERRIEMLNKRLNLTQEQVAQIKTIDQDGMTQVKALREDTTLAPVDRHARIKAVHDAQNAKIREVLTEEQKSKFDEMIARQQQQHTNHRRGPGEDPDQGPPPPPPAA